MLTFVKRELKGYLTRNGWTPPTSFQGPSALYLLLLHELCVHQELNIIQVGAYDGVTGDPLRAFILDHANDVNLVLFEPQTEPFRKLQALYRDSSNVRCVNKAVGAAGTLTFYSVNEKYKQWYRQKTGQDPTAGTNSFFREHVAVRLKRRGVRDVDEFIDQYEMQVTELLTELGSATPFHERTDLLQIDCEGMDDEVVYHSGIDVLKPRMINFDSKSLMARSPEKLQKLKDYLRERGYEITTSTRVDTLAIRVGP